MATIDIEARVRHALGAGWLILRRPDGSEIVRFDYSALAVTSPARPAPAIVPAADYLEGTLALSTWTAWLRRTFGLPVGGDAGPYERIQAEPDDTLYLSLDFANGAVEIVDTYDKTTGEVTVAPRPALALSWAAWQVFEASHALFADAVRRT